MLAQDWATRAVCDVDKAVVHDSVLTPPGRVAIEAEAAKISNGIGRLWQITAPSGTVSHLWGTYHSTATLILDLPDEVRSRIAGSTTVAVEVDYTSESRDAYREAQYFEGRYKEASDPFALLPSGGAIAGLPQEVSDWIRDRAFELGWTEDAELILSPAGMAEMLLSDPCEDFASGIIPIQDDYIQLLGRLAGAKIQSLEIPEEFFSDLEAMPETAEAITQVYAAYLQPVDTNEARATSFALYLSGRIDMMFALDHAFITETLGPMGETALQRANDYLLDFRNERFLQRLRVPLERGGVFIAIGAGHLPGDGGMVNLLRDAGYQVTRIHLPGEAK